MRNLKRVLSLAMASVMLLGMMVIGAGAADKKPLSDLDKVNHKEAVNLMVDLGIIVGKPDGSFAPTETINRASMAKLITYIMMGDINPDLFAGVSTDLKDIDSNWAKGFIKFCYSNGIITGDGAGHFMPDTEVTVVAAAKMLLVAIGYDATVQGYVGSNWSVNIMREAKLAGLLEGISAGTNDKLSRDNAARMIFNALFTETIQYGVQWDGGKAYKANPSKTGTTLGATQYNLGKIESTVTGINSDGTAQTTALNANSGPNGLINGQLTATPDQVGSKVVAYYNTSTGKLISTVLTVGDSTVLGTSTDGTSIAKLTTRGEDKYIAELNAGATYYVNGVSGTPVVGRGSIVELIDNDKDGKANVVRVTNKTVATLAAAPVYAKNSAGDEVVTISSITGLVRIETSKVIGYEDLKKDDVVLYVKLGETYHIEKATSVSGVVSGLHNTKGIQLDGSYYLDSALSGAANVWSSDYVNTYTFYLDNGKNIVKAVKDTSATATSYAVLTDVAWVTGSGVEGSNYVEGKLLFADGTTQVVKIATVDGVKAVAAGSSIATGLKYNDGSAVATTSGTPTALANTFYYEATGAKIFGVGSLTAATGKTLNAAQTAIGTDKAFVSTGAFYSYTKNSSGAYVLTSTPNGTDTFATVSATINNNGVNTNVGATANASTVFLYAVTGSNGNVTYTAYTGINNAPKATGITTTANSIVKNSSGFATLVYVAANSSNVSGSYSSDLVYITSANFTTKVVDGATRYVQSAIVNGTKKDIEVTANVGVGMYIVTDSTTAGVLTLGALTTEADHKVGVKGNVGGVLVTTDNTAYTYTDSTVVYFIDSDGNSTEMKGDSIVLDGTNALYIVKKSTGNNVAETIYVVEKSAKPATLIVGGTATISTNTDLILNPVSVSGAIGEDVTVTATAPAGVTTVTYTVTIKGVAGPYVLAAADSNTTLAVKVLATDSVNNTVDEYNFTISVGTVS